MTTFKLLFVCMGNICRSPAAEGVMRRVVLDAGLHDRVHIDSAGTEDWHQGKRADARMIQAAAQRGLDLTHIARQATRQDLAEFDLVLVMDEQNRQGLLRADPHREHQAKVRFFCEFCTRHEDREVPDPYYGGAEGFEHVLNLLEDGCEGVLAHIRSRLA